MNTWKELVFSDEEKGRIQEITIDTPSSTTMGAPKFLSRFHDLSETKTEPTTDMGSTEIGEATNYRGHKDPLVLDFTLGSGPFRCKQRNTNSWWWTAPEQRAHKADLLRA